MSAAVNEAPSATDDGDAPVASGEAGVDPAKPFLESDTRETQMTYDESSRVPWWVTLVWVFSLLGLLAYTIVYLFPDLAKWGSP